MDNTISYTDTHIIINKRQNSFETRLKKSDGNKSYAEAKVTEMILNQFPGSWPVKAGEAHTRPGMRCFSNTWNGDALITKWEEPVRETEESDVRIERKKDEV